MGDHAPACVCDRCWPQRLHAVIADGARRLADVAINAAAITLAAAPPPVTAPPAVKRATAPRRAPMRRKLSRKVPRPIPESPPLVARWQP